MMPPLKLNGSINRHNDIGWALENPHFTRGDSVVLDISIGHCRTIPFLNQASTVDVYLKVQQESVGPQTEEKVCLVTKRFTFSIIEQHSTTVSKQLIRTDGLGIGLVLNFFCVPQTSFQWTSSYVNTSMISLPT